MPRSLLAPVLPLLLSITAAVSMQHRLAGGAGLPVLPLSLAHRDPRAPSMRGLDVPHTGHNEWENHKRRFASLELFVGAGRNLGLRGGGEGELPSDDEHRGAAGLREEGEESLRDLKDGIERQRYLLSEEGNDRGFVNKCVLREGGKGGNAPGDNDLVSVRLEVWFSDRKSLDTDTAIGMTLGKVQKEVMAGRKQNELSGNISEAEYQILPPQQKFCFGGKVVADPDVRTCSAVPGCYSFALGESGGPPLIPPGVEMAIRNMTVGEVASVVVGGDLGFDAQGYAEDGNDLGVPPKMPCEFVVELVAVNTVDVLHDKGAVVTWGRRASERLREMMRGSSWRFLERRPSPMARVRIKGSRSLFDGRGVVVASEGGEEDRWVEMGRGLLPLGVELALARVCVLGVRYAVAVRGLYRKRDPEKDDQGEWRFEEAMGDTYQVTVLDWDETVDLAGDGGIIVEHKSIAQLNADQSPIADGDSVVLNVRAAAASELGGAKREFMAMERRKVSVGDYTWPAGLERALLGLRRGQNCAVTLRQPYLGTMIWDMDGKAVSVGPPLSQEASFEETYEFAVCEIRSAGTRSVQDQIDMSRLRRAMGNNFFEEGQYERALEFQKKGLMIVMTWGVEGISLNDTILSGIEDQAVNGTRMQDEELRLYQIEMMTRCRLNIAACYLKLRQGREAEMEANRLMREVGPIKKAMRRRCQARILLGHFKEAKRDAEDLMQQCKQTTAPQSSMEARVGGVPLIEAQRLLALVAEEKDKSLSAQKKLYGKMFGAGSTPRKDVHQLGVVNVSRVNASNGIVGRKQSTKTAVDGEGRKSSVDPSNVITSIKAVSDRDYDDDDYDKKDPMRGYVVLEREGESKAGEMKRLSDEARERHKLKAAGEAVAKERMKKEQTSAVRFGEHSTPRGVPVHVSDANRLGEDDEDDDVDVENEDVGVGGGKGQGEENMLDVAEKIETEGKRVMAELRHVIRISCDALRMDGPQRQQARGISQLLRTTRDATMQNQRQADEMLVGVLQKRNETLRRPKPLSRHELRQAAHAGVLAEALRRKGDVCMNIVSKIDMLLDPHVDPGQVLHLVEEDEAREREGKGLWDGWRDIHQRQKTQDAGGEGAGGDDCELLNYTSPVFSEDLTEKVTEYKTTRSDRSIDSMIDQLQGLSLAQAYMNETVHQRCPGHVHDEKNPDRPCPNCDLVGTKINRVWAPEPAEEGEWRQGVVRDEDGCYTRIVPAEYNATAEKYDTEGETFDVEPSEQADVRMDEIIDQIKAQKNTRS